MKLLEPPPRTERPSIPDSPTQPEPQPDVRMRRRRALAGGLAVLAAGAATSSFLLAAGDDGAHDHTQTHSHAQARLAMQPVGFQQVDKVSGGKGMARLDVAAEAPASGGRLPAIPAGAAVQLTYTLPDGTTGKPTVVAHRLETSIKAMTDGQQEAGPRDQGGGGGHGQHHGGGGQNDSGAAAVRPSKDQKYAGSVELDREETFLFSSRKGDVVIPNRPSSSEGAQPGQGLAQAMIPGGGLKGALKLKPHADSSLPDPAGRYLVASYGDEGRIEVADILRRRAAGGLDLDGRPRAAAFAPDGRVWVSDDDGKRIFVVDVSSRRVVREIEAGSGRKSIAFDDSGARALVAATDGSATVVDVRSMRAIRSVPAGKNLTSVAYAKKLGAFVVADASGSISTIPATGNGAPRRTELGRDMDTRAVAVAPDGRTAVTANARANTLSVIDLERRKVVSVDAGAQPTEVKFLGRFAISRNAGSADVTWVDAITPERSNNIEVGKAAPASAMSLTPDGREVLLATPGDKAMVGLHVMMGRPMLMEQTPNALGADHILASGGGLQRVGARRYEQRTVLDQPGQYHVEVRMPNGSKAEFQLPVSSQRAGEARVRPERGRIAASVGEPVKVRFRVQGATLRDAQVVATATGLGVRQFRASATRQPGGVYEASLDVAEPGTYRVELMSETRGWRPKRGSSAVLKVSGR